MNFEIGDTVYVRPHTHENMHGEVYPASSSEKTGVIVSLHKRWRWSKSPEEASVRIMSPDEDSAWDSHVDLVHLALVKKGNGTFILGTTHPYSKQEQRELRWDAYLQRLQATDLRHEGFCNAATFLAWVYLNQESRFHAVLPGLRRKDGSINPSKVKKEFQRLNLKVDSWAFEPPLDVPSEFEGRQHTYALGINRSIDWREVTAEFELRLPYMVAAL